jgi:hypothetical protein
MSNLKKIAVGAGITIVAVGGAAYLLKMHRTSAQLEIINTANLHKIDLTGLYIRVDSIIKNPSDGSFKIKFPFVKLKYNDAIVGTSQVINKDISIAAFGEAHIDGIIVHIPFMGLLSLGAKIFTAIKNGTPVQMKVNTITTIDLGWKQLPYETTDDIVIKK